MTAPPVVAGPEATAAEARALCAGRAVRHLPVVADGRLVGIVTAADLRGAAGSARLADLMTADPDTLAPDDTLQAAARQLATSDHHALPVTDAAGRVVGIVTSTDLVALLLTQVGDDGPAQVPDDLEAALRTAGQRVAAGDDPDGLAAVLLAVAARGRLLELAVRRADEYLHSGGGAREHAALVQAIGRLGAGATPRPFPGGRL